MRVLCLSDVHAGPGLGPWEWLDSAGVQRLKGFVDGSSSEADVLALIGDIWDLWVVPHDVQPPSTSDALAMGPAREVFEIVAQAAERMSVVYSPGNHDMSLRPGMQPPGVGWVFEGAYRYECLHAEHGHSHSLFCAPDPWVMDQLPLGYFVSRLAATADRDSGGHMPTRQEIIAELLETSLGYETLPEALIDAVAARAKVTLDEPILMPEDLWGGCSTTLRQVRQLYRDLVRRWERRRGLLATAMAIPAETGHLDPAADMLLARGGCEVVVMGHTHRPMRADSPIGTYANTGCWSNGSEGSWVLVDGLRATLERP